jgi:hypothetical protein
MFTYTINGVKKEAVLLFYKPHNYCDAVSVYFFESYAAAKEAADEINGDRVHQFSDFAEAEEIPNGGILTFTEPYDD